MNQPTVHHGDCIAIMAGMPEASVDAIVCDPPYDLTAGKKGGTGTASLNLNSPAGRSRISTGGGFMGKQWDATGVAFDPDTWRAALRVLKPGGHLLAFGGTRTWHRLAVAVEDAGFEIRDSIAWLYGQGFPKGKNVLKPAHEPIVVARKPFSGNERTNVLQHGTGALNIEACRLGDTGGGVICPARDADGRCTGHKNAGRSTSGETFHADSARWPSSGRWPTNVVLDEGQVAALDAQPGGRHPSPSRTPVLPNRRTTTGNLYGNGKGIPNATQPVFGYDDKGGASRFFYVARKDDECDPASTAESSSSQPSELAGSAPSGAAISAHPDTARLTDSPSTSATASESSTSAPSGTPPNSELGDLGSRFRYCAKAPKSERPVVGGVAHPTVKPLALMRWLVRLVTPPDGLVLDPFAGSGTTIEAATLEGFRVIGIEREQTYLPLIQERIRRSQHRTVEADDEPTLFGESA